MTKKWGIVGLGWLGSELAARLAQAKIEYWGTTRKNFDWERDAFPREACDVLLLNTPPLTNISPQHFVDKIHPQSGKIIFVSSIGVYGDISGTITEETTPRPHTKNGIWLYQVEQLLLEKFQGQLTILRAGGLIGGLRHPVISLAKNPTKIVKDGFLNLIHRNDLIEIIFKVSEQNMDFPIINAVAPHHPLKSTYYHFWSKKLNLDSIQFAVDRAECKIINSKILASIYPHWQCLELDEL